MTKKDTGVAYCALILITAVTASMFFNVNKALGSPPEESTLKCTGKVVDSSGQAVNVATVKLYFLTTSGTTSGTLTMLSVETKLVKEVTTNADGMFSFDISKDEFSIYRMGIITAQKEGLAVGWADWGLKEDKKDVEIKLTEPKELAGLVVDENNKPIAEAQVSILIMSRGDLENGQHINNYGGKKEFFAVKTDTSGKFVFKEIPADAKAEFMVKKAGRATICTSNPAGKARQYLPGQSDIKLVQAVETRIEGVVLEKDSGKPVKGVKIMAGQVQEQPIFGLNEIISKEDGTFSLAELPTGTYSLMLVPQGEGPSEWVGEPVQVETEAGKTTSGIKIEVSKGGLFEVVVTEADTKKPVEGAIFYFGDTTSRILSRKQTDKEGIAQIKLAAGEYRFLGVYKEGLTGRLTGGQEQTFTIEEGRTKRLEIQLKGPSKITGVVKDKEGKALEGVKLKIIPLSSTEVSSNAEGKFETGWDLRIWGGETPVIYLIARDEKNNLANITEVNEETKEVDIKLKSGLTFTGRVVDPNGKGIEQAEIMVYLIESSWGASISEKHYQTDSEGRFEIKAIPEEYNYNLYATAENYGKSRVNIDISTAQNNKLDAGDIKLNVANLSVSGIVVDANDEPVAGARVDFYGVNQPERQSLTTDKDGKFTIEKVCAGSLNISAQLDKPPEGYMYGSIQTEGGAEDVKIVVSERGSSDRYVPRKPASLKGKALPDMSDFGIKILPADVNDKMICVCFFDMQQRPSRHTANELAKQADELKDKGVIVAIVQTAKVEEKTLKEWIEKYNIPFPAGQISGDVEKTKFNWGVQSLPWLILTDKKHTIKAEGFNVGELEEKIKQTVAGDS